MKKRLKNNQGFTLVEMMVAIAIFSIVIVFGISALLHVNKVHKVNQRMRQLIDTLDFAMEDMSRNIRLGYDYYCVVSTDVESGISAYFSGIWPVPQNPTFDCDAKIEKALVLEGMNGIFPEVIGNITNIDEHRVDQIVYKIVPSGGFFKIKKSIDGGASYNDMVSEEIRLNSKSGFMVFGAPDPFSQDGGENNQPRVLIRLSGEIYYKDTTLPFDIQTTVAQRFLDN